MSQSVKALPQTPQASQNWSLMQVLLEKKRNIILPLTCWSYLNFTSEGLPGEIYVVCCFVFVFVFLLLNRRVKKLKNTRQKKKTTESPLSCTHWIPQYTRRCFSATCNYKSFHADKKKKSFYADVLEKIGFPRTHHFVWEDTASKLVELPIMAIFIH